MTDSYDYFKNKRTDRVYLSPSLKGTSFSSSDVGGFEYSISPFGSLQR